MATRYVSSAAINGFPVGNNANNGTTQALAWLTLDYAFSNTSAGDTIIVNGDHRSASSFAMGDRIVQAAVSGQPTLYATGAQTRVINILATTGNPTLDGINVDGENLCTNAVTVHASNTATYVIKNGEFRNAKQQQILDSNPVALGTIKNVKLNGVATQGGIGVDLMGATKRVEIEGVNGTLTGVTSRAGIYMSATASGAETRITGVSLNVTVASTATCANIYTRGVIATVEGNNDLVISETVTGGAQANIIVAPGTSAFLCENSVIRFNSGKNNCSDGYGILGGADGSLGVLDNQANRMTIYDNEMTGNPASGSMHGVVLGGITQGIASHNVLRDFGLPELIKDGIDCVLIANSIEGLVSNGSGAIRFKGATRGRSVGDKVRADGSTNNLIIQVDSDPATSTNSIGCVVVGHISTNTIPETTAVNVAVGSDCIFRDNVYSYAGGVSGTPWNYQGTGYTTLAAWAAARERSARNVVPTSVDRTYYRYVYRGMIRAALLKYNPALLPCMWP